MGGNMQRVVFHSTFPSLHAVAMEASQPLNGSVTAWITQKLFLNVNVLSSTLKGVSHLSICSAGMYLKKKNLISHFVGGGPSSLHLSFLRG